MNIHVVQCWAHCRSCGNYHAFGKGYQFICEYCGALMLGIDHIPTAADQKQAEETMRSQETAEIKFKEQ